jgi:hypothetical protein
LPKRTHIPILKKCLAARAQLVELDSTPPRRPIKLSLTLYLETMLIPMLESRLGSPLQLDHEPALGLRKTHMMDDGSVVYFPDEHDHRFLRYRQSAVHLEKTIGRKAGAERTVTTKGSDIWLMAKFDRLEGRTKQGRKQKIPSRPFPKAQRKFR